MNWYKLIWHYQSRSKFWGWSEMLALTGKMPSEIKDLVSNFDTNELVDPMSVLTYNHKNYLYTKSIIKNYSNPNYFIPTINSFGVFTNLIVMSKNPVWANYIYDTNWYWKQQWIQKYGQILYFCPSVKSVHLGCSCSLQISNAHSDLDLIIETFPNTVWATKVYFAILSKILKYYDFNFWLWLRLKVQGKSANIEILKHNFLENKTKIDFGLVYESNSTKEPIWQKYYSDKERHISSWRQLQIVLAHHNLVENNPQNSYSGKLLVDSTIPVPIFYLGKILVCLLFPVFFLVGTLAYWHQRRVNKHNKNMIALWNIYSQYNLVY